MEEDGCENTEASALSLGKAGVRGPRHCRGRGASVRGSRGGSSVQAAGVLGSESPCGSLRGGRK